MRLPLSILDKSLRYLGLCRNDSYGDDRIKMTILSILGAYECVAENDKGVGISEPVKIQVLCK